MLSVSRFCFTATPLHDCTESFEMWQSFWNCQTQGHYLLFLHYWQSQYLHRMKICLNFLQRFGTCSEFRSSEDFNCLWLFPLRVNSFTPLHFWKYTEFVFALGQKTNTACFAWCWPLNGTSTHDPIPEHSCAAGGAAISVGGLQMLTVIKNNLSGCKDLLLPPQKPARFSST